MSMTNHYNDEYNQWLTNLKTRIRQSQIKAAIKVNTELLHLYWDLGKDIVIRQTESTWGSGFLKQLSKDLKKVFLILSKKKFVTLEKSCIFMYIPFQTDPSIPEHTDLSIPAILTPFRKRLFLFLIDLVIYFLPN